MENYDFITARSLLKEEKIVSENYIKNKVIFNIQDVREKIRSGNFELDIIKNISWKDFEIFCSDILKINGFSCINNVRFKSKNKKRYEIDILAMSKIKKILFSIDAKHWKIGGRSKIEGAIINQARRTNNLFFNSIKIFNYKLNLEKYKDFKKIPLIITLNKEEIKIYQGIPVIPLEKLDNFLLDFEGYIDLMLHF
ncbi:MAG: hypothetical protein EAX96_15260 [Candidatus Lokiarchaeota archaeon]|nr:hypothetical protein [Candidatus Lokiarchaeota archaeon]